ncbi:hypothetical protein F4809DRAFT_643025 [Biscogniauxia mediterranea]|nr:hypothetical protein F4809DRAFT_643025 [Biscogniauxia mediterranea]
MASASISLSLLWTLVLLVTALLLALVVAAQILATYTSAYLAAPTEITTFLDAVDFSIQENESYDRDVSRVQRLDDKLRLGRLLQEIQRGGDDLREDLNRLVLAEGGTKLSIGARVLWAIHRKQLEERVRRLDMLRMRFLVVYMGIIATAAGERGKHAERTMARMSLKDHEKAASHYQHHHHHHHHNDDDDDDHHHPGIPKAPPLPRSLTENIKHRTSSQRSVTMQPMSSRDSHRAGWEGVVQELRHSPLMHKRHASIEMASRSPTPVSPLSSPLSLSPSEKLESLSED